MKRLLVKGVTLLVATLGMSVSAFATTDISGKWQCSGYDPATKEKFTTNVMIAKTGPHTYGFIDWTDAKTGEKLKGSAVQNKTHGEHFATVLWSEDKPGYIGFGVYEIKSDGNLFGQRTTKDAKMVAEELCTKIPS